MWQHASRTSNDTPSNVMFTRVPLSEQTPLSIGVKFGFFSSTAEEVYTTLTRSTPEKSCKMDLSSSFTEMWERQVEGERERQRAYNLVGCAQRNASHMRNPSKRSRV